MPDQPPYPTGSDLDIRRLIIGVERALATRHGEMAEALIGFDADSSATTFRLLDGVVALFGPGMFVNHAMAVGLESTVENDDLALLEGAAAAVGVSAAIETIVGVTPESLVELLGERGYRPTADTSVLVRPLSSPIASHEPTYEITEVDDGGVDEWAALSAESWGHVEPGPRSANDRFAQIAHRAGTPGLLVARERSSGRGIACADLHVDGDIAILGGASTLPTARGRGAQSALVQYRLHAARSAGAVMAISTAEPASQSERNLIRLGFERSQTKRLWRQPP